MFFWVVFGGVLNICFFKGFFGAQICCLFLLSVGCFFYWGWLDCLVRGGLVPQGPAS